MVAWLSKPVASLMFGADPVRIALAGHSMGGWATSQVASRDPALIGAVLISAAEMARLATLPRPARVKAAAENTETLVTTPEAMADELAGAVATMILKETALGLAKVPVLILSSDDGLAPGTDALAAAIRAEGGKVQMAHQTTDHSWSDRRLTLAGLVIDWLKALPGPN